ALQEATLARIEAEQRAETEKQRAETEKQRAETEKQRAETEKQRADELAALLNQYRQQFGDLSK
ncbi:MAG: Uma2 family endonuclease, partial [Arthrospira platensis PCC 7345]|nr:Uma2 family endonuclease [Arthrospira platensis PCC 7345]MDT9313887.1 Uma2 family endonuclease [Limnospira sp. Paracas R14]